MLGTDVIWTARTRRRVGCSTSPTSSPERRQVHPVHRGHHGVRGQELGRPVQLQRGFIYYRTDEVDTAPKTWEDLYKEAQQGNGVVYQGFRYEGLTVNFLELSTARAGAPPDGKEATADSQEVKDVLTSWPRASRTARR